MKLETDELTNSMKRAVDYLQSHGRSRTIEEVAAISQAISLKRIADALEAQQFDYGGRKILNVMTTDGDR